MAAAGEKKKSADGGWRRVHLIRWGTRYDAVVLDTADAIKLLRDGWCIPSLIVSLTPSLLLASRLLLLTVQGKEEEEEEGIKVGVWEDAKDPIRTFD